MAYDIGRLRQQNLMGGYDQLTPGAGGNYMEENSNPTSPYTPGPGLESIGAQQDRDTILGPTGEPLNQGGIQAPTIDPVGATPTRSNGPTLKETIDAINAGYSPDYTSRDRLNALLNEAPTRQAPGWGRALVAAGMSIKAQDPIATAEKVMYAPYMRDVEEWKTRADPYYKAAELENRQNINERTLVSNAATAHSAAERNRIAQENNEMRNAVAVTRNNIQQAKNRGLKVEKAGDRFVGINPETHERFDLGSSGGMTREEEINALGEWGVKRAEASGAAAVDRIRAGGGQVYDTPEGPRRYNPNDPETPATPVPGLPKGSSRIGTDRPAPPPNALERGRIEQEAIRNARPDNPIVRKWTKGDGKGGYTWKDRPVPHPDTWWPGDHVPESEAEEYDDARRAVDPTYEPGKAKGLGPTTATQNPQAKTKPIGGSSRIPDPNDQTSGMDDGIPGEVTPDMPKIPPPGTIRMRTPDGRIVNVPANKVAEAEKNGGRRLR